MKYDAYFPMSWIYNTDGEFVGDLFLHCVFDIGTPSLDILNFLAEQRGSHNGANTVKEVEHPFIVNAKALQIPTPWKLSQWNWVHTCKNENIAYAEGSNAIALDEGSEVWKYIDKAREYANSFYVPYTLFAGGDFIKEEQPVYAVVDYTFSILVSPFTEEYAEGLYYLYDQHTLSTQCPEPLMRDAVLLYKKSRTASPFFKRYMKRMFGGMKTVQGVDNVTQKKSNIANLTLLKQMQAVNKNQAACYQLMDASDKAPYEVRADELRGTPIKIIDIAKPIQLNVSMFDWVHILGEGLMQGTRIQLGESTKKLSIGARHNFNTLAYYKTPDRKNSCVSMVAFYEKAPQLSEINMVAAVSNDTYLKSLINLGIAGQTQLSLSIPYMLNCAPMLDLRELEKHCASSRIEFGLQPTENIILGTPSYYRYGITVTRPKCAVILSNSEKAKYESKFSVADRNLVFYIPTFSRSHLINVDTTAVVSGRHMISFVDSPYLYETSHEYQFGTRITAQTYAKYLQRARENFQLLNLPNIYADDEATYFANKPRCLTQVNIKIKTTTSILLSSALQMTVIAAKAVKTLIFVELEDAVAGAEVHIYGDVETLRIYASDTSQYTYYVHGVVKNIIKEEQGFSRDSRVSLASSARSNVITVHVRPGLAINTMSSSNTETVFYCADRHENSNNFGRLLPYTKDGVSAIGARFALYDSEANKVKLVPDVK